MSSNLACKRLAKVNAIRRDCENIDALMPHRGRLEAAVLLRDKLAKNYESYVIAHDAAVQQKGSAAAYQKTHEEATRLYKEYSVLLDGYVKDCRTPASHKSTESRDQCSKSIASRKTTTTRKTAAQSEHTRASKSRHTSYVSISSSARLAQVRVQEKLEQKRLEQLKQVQAMEKQQQVLALQQKDLENAIAVTEQTHRLESLAEEAHLLQLEEVRSQLGSDYESDDEDPARADVTKQPTTTKAVGTGHAAARGKEVPRVSCTPSEKTAPTTDEQRNFQLLCEYQRLVDANPQLLQESVELQQPRPIITQDGYNPPTSLLWSGQTGYAPAPPRDVFERRRLAQTDGPTDTASGRSSVQQRTTQQLDSGMEMIGRVLMENSALTPFTSKFDGNPADYLTFMSHYQLNVEPEVRSAGKRLQWLLNNVGGEARELIHTCSWTEHEKGLEKALKLLKKNYGEDHMIANSYLRKLMEGPKIKQFDAKAIIGLSNEMENCKSLLEGLSLESNLDTPGAVKMIARRLPNHLLLKWTSKSSYFISELKRQPGFEDLRQFIEKQADKVNTADMKELYEEMMKEKQPPAAKKPQKEPKQPRVTVTTLATSADFSSKPAKQTSKTPTVKTAPASCAYCEKTGHGIEKCFEFEKMSPPERFTAVRKRHLCFRCLGKGHSRWRCRGRCSKCKRTHHTLLHDPEKAEKETAAAATEEKEETPAEVQVAVATAAPRNATFGVLPVRIQAGGKEARVLALLDSGSTITLVRREVCDQLGIEGSPTPMRVNTLGGPTAADDSTTCLLAVFSDDLSEKVEVRALTVTDIPIRHDRQINCNEWPHLKDLCLPNETGPVDLVIGVDCTYAFRTMKEVCAGRDDPVARQTPLGWIVFGSTSAPGVPSVNFAQPDPLQLQLERMWEVDFRDARSSEPAMSVDDKKALAYMSDTLHQEGGKFHVGIPWRQDPERTLPNNRCMAEARLRMLKKKFLADPKVAESYTDTVESYIKDEHARLVSDEEAAEDHQWFLPHHAVTKKSDPSKCRVVFDCAAEVKGVSLNSIIHQGPNFLNNLAGVLIRFRKEPVALVADIKLMFHQCFVLPEDQRFLRFLWWPEGDVNRPAKVYAMKVHLFGGKSSPSVVNYCMRRTAEDNEADFSELAVDTLRRAFYMDDMLQSVDSVETAKKLVPEMKKLLQRGGFTLAKFMSTEHDVISSIPPDDRAKSLQGLSIEDATLPQESALGLQWNVEGDFFTYLARIEEKPYTRRGLLSTTAGLYDPLGLIAPIVLVPKLIQQELCRQQLGWDDAIPEAQEKAIRDWRSSTDSLANIRVPRCFQKGPSAYSERELHVFCDASEQAYGVAAYIKVMAEEEVSVSLVLGKSRVAPLKTISIPRLELTAAALAAKISSFLKGEFDWDELPTYFWSDSMTTLHYIRNVSTRFKAFVAHRVALIQDLTEVESWNYVPTNVNPADLASRGFDANDAERLNFWLKGPQFLGAERAYSRLFEEPPEEQQLETRVVCMAEAVDGIELFIQRFSSLQRLLKCTAWAMKFIRRFSGAQVPDHVTVDEITAGKGALIRYSQKKCFPREFDALQKGHELGPSSPLYRLDPVLKDGLLCVRGRMANASGAFNKSPTILPDHHLSDLIIDDIHRKTAHSGAGHVFSVLRREFYILRGQTRVKKLLDRCVTCKKKNGRPMTQKMADLPAERVTTSEPPFTNVGVDYFGPLHVKFRRGSTKRYGCIFTCLATRAVHIEVSHSLDANSFLMALHRFMARRGKPAKLFSDNGTNFVAADRELAEEIAQINGKRVEDEMLVQAIEWQFNPPHAPHMGGVWERLIRSVKTILQTLVGDRLLTDEELLTFLSEAEKVMNDRPLTRMGPDPDDLTPLTPNHLLLLRGNSCEPNTEANHVRRRWQVIQDIANQFFERFIGEYLPGLQARQKWCATRANLKKGDLVLLTEDDVKRGKWPLGRVEEVETSSDGLVRAATLRTANGLKRRPISKLIFLESE